MSKKRTRNETKFRATESKDGRFSPKLDKATSERFIRYCKMMDLNKTITASTAINYWLDAEERKALEEKSKEELIELILRR